MLGVIQLSIMTLGLHGAASTLAAQDIQQLIDVLEVRVPQLMTAKHVPGLSMVLIRQNKIVWKGTFGVRVAGKPERVDDETIFEAASMSKPLFTYCALKLVEDGQFDLDRLLDSYLAAPYLPDQPLAAKITGRMVMLHRTGLPNWRPGGWRGGGPLKVLHEPGTRFGYSGEGYLYLQTAIEHRVNEPMSAWMQRLLLTPLSMTRSSYEWRDLFADNFAGGHDKDGHFKSERRFYTHGNAAYSLYTTPTDYARFLIEMMRRDRSAPHSLKSESIEKMTTLQVKPEQDDPLANRALGWVVEAKKNGGWVSHSGSNGSGFQCNARFNVERQCGSVIMTNSVNGRKVWEAILSLIDSVPAEGSSTSAKPQAGRQKKVTTWGPVQRTIRYDYRLMNPTSKPATKIVVNVPLPLQSPRQVIHYLHIADQRQHRFFTDEHGQRLVQYSIDRIEPGQSVDLGYVVGITLSNMSWNAERQPVRADAPVLTAEQRRRYLKPAVNYSMDTDLMRQAAASLVQGAATDFQKLVRIHDYVISKIRYVRDSKWDPAATVLVRGTGSCSEYNYVLSGLCRLAGLPTRCVGATTNGFRDLPTTDAVYHRWTEVFLNGYGWFPADCSRDANPIRGKRSHFGRVYTDVMVWCRQAGGTDDTLGWDYRAKAHISGDDPGVRESHRTRWFAFHSESDVEAAYAWLLGGVGTQPEPDVLECALLHWHEATLANQLKLIRSLAAAGRCECLRWAATLPEAGDVRATCVKQLCASTELADTLLAKSHDLFAFRNWFKNNELRFASVGEDKFKLTLPAVPNKAVTTTASSTMIWKDLVPEVARQLESSQNSAKWKSVVVMPVADQTVAGLGEPAVAIHVALKTRIGQDQNRKIKLIDEVEFDRCMAEHGPGSGEYWILANDRENGMSPELVPEVVLVPIAITSRAGPSVLYRLERVERNVMLAFHLRPQGATPRRGTPWYTRHDASDWAVPLAELDPGTIVEDRYPARLAGIPAGTLEVYAAMLDTTRAEGRRIVGKSQLLDTVKIRARARSTTQTR